MKIDVICVGKIKEQYLKDAIGEYSKRLTKYCKLSILEVADEKTDENASDALNQMVKDKEAQRILKLIDEHATVVSLEIEGKMYDSVEFSSLIEHITINGNSHIQFVIGGSLGLSKAVTDRADYHISFSRMTFPHQLMRVILLEQVYRAYRISSNEPYHK